MADSDTAALQLRFAELPARWLLQPRPAFAIAKTDRHLHHTLHQNVPMPSLRFRSLFNRRGSQPTAALSILPPVCLDSVAADIPRLVPAEDDPVLQSRPTAVCQSRRRRSHTLRSLIRVLFRRRHSSVATKSGRKTPRNGSSDGGIITATSLDDID
jgi:hypothetical protein